jgi:K(+)-stimulated pyrophosphate-energized sodium pump
MEQQLVYVLGWGAPLVAAIFAFGLVRWISAQDPGTDQMRRIAALIRAGAMAFLKVEYSVLAVFVAVMVVLLAVFLPEHGVGTAISFVVGASLSALAGWIGMRTATTAAVRTTNAARTGLAPALRVAFSSGAVMGLTVVALGTAGLTTMYWAFGGLAGNGPMAVAQLFGFSLGASSIALFARVGGGIFTKAADVAGDLSGKVEAGIPEDDPRNPATIADSVGDNVGDVAGMGADLFESYVGSIIAAMTLGAFLSEGASSQLVLLPLAIAALGILSSIIGTFFVKAKDEHGLHSALFRGLLIASLVTAAGSWVITNYWMTIDITLKGTHVDGMDLFWVIVAGLAAGVLIGKVTEYYTAKEAKPAQYIAEQSNTGPATNIIHGLATGMESVALPVILICGAIGLSYWLADVYGVALAAVGMLATLGISLGIDAYGPVADNAGGMAEMAGLPKEVRKRTDALDAVGNTTAAIGKGFAIGSAALTALALFSAFCTAARPGAEAMVLDINNPHVMVGLLIGGFLPFLFSAMTMRAVGKAANEMVSEIRRQFREIPGLLEGKGKPDAARCVEISTRGSLKQMVVPGALAIAAPLLVGRFLGVEALGGMLAGALVTGVMMAIFMANAGGAWDNAKKFIEDGNHGGKGSDAHKAAVVGDTVGDPFKDTSGPAINILIKLMTVVGLVFLPWFL